ncbi:MAG: hypothetical protein QOE35_3554 [Actinomycetota bacterium]
MASALSRWGPQWFHRVSTKVEATSFETLVAAVIGAEVFLLAMFYATVGVIASTSYQSVPGEIRQLFVQERGSRLFTRSVVRALVVGVLVLAMPIVGYKPYGLTVVVLVGLVVFSVLNLVALGTGLFNFFDVSSLSTPLPKRFARALRLAASSGDEKASEVEQQLAHREGAEVLQYYRQLATLLKERTSNETAAPRRVLHQLVLIAELNSAMKSQIPSDSGWYARIPAHRNWLTLDHSRLGIALSTRTGVQPDLVPDRLWVEREISARVQDLLPLLLTAAAWAHAIEITDEFTRVLARMSARLQVEEARLLVRVMTKCLADAVANTPHDDPRAGIEHEAGTLRTFRLAAAERSVLTLTAVWLGLVRAAEAVSEPSLKTVWAKAVEESAAPYTVAAPRELLSTLEEIAAGIALERRAEGHRVTPSWWIHHYAARSLLRQILTATDELLGEVQHQIARVVAVSIDDDSELGAVMAFDALELVSKVRSHFPAIGDAVSVLSEFRSSQAGDDLWPVTDHLSDPAAALEDELLRYLAKVSVKLDTTTHDTARPDLFGQAYKILFDACFSAILDGADDLARVLFPPVVFAADRARRRLVDDLADQGLQTRFIFATEPLVDLMELSGYAMLMQLLNNSGIWDDVQNLWDGILTKEVAPALAEQMALVQKEREAIFALTQGGLERTSRQMLLNRLLKSRGVVESHYWSPFEKERPLSHPSAIVRVFAPGEMGSFEEVADLFLVEYLIKQPGCEHFELSHRANTLRDQLERERERGDGPIDEAATADETTPPVTNVEHPTQEAGDE